MGAELDPIEEIEARIRELGVPEDVIQMIGQAIRRNARALAAHALSFPSQRSVSVGQVAQHFHRLALRRVEIIGPDMMGDAAWHMLLALVADEEIGKRPSVSSLCAASGVPTTTALRYVTLMERVGLIERSDDIRDARRALLNLTYETRVKMHTAIRNFCVPAEIVRHDDC